MSSSLVLEGREEGWVSLLSIPTEAKEEGEEGGEKRGGKRVNDRLLRFQRSEYRCGLRFFSRDGDPE